MKLGAVVGLVDSNTVRISVLAEGRSSPKTHQTLLLELLQPSGLPLGLHEHPPHQVRLLPQPAPRPARLEPWWSLGGTQIKSAMRSGTPQRQVLIRRQWPMRLVPVQQPSGVSLLLVKVAQ